MIASLARPGAAVLIGYTGGVLLALYPNLLPRSVVTQLAIVVPTGAVGAAAGLAFAVCTGRGRRPSDFACQVCVRLTVLALLGWLLWQQKLLGESGLPRLSPMPVLLVAAAVTSAPYVGTYLCAQVRTIGWRARVAALVSVIMGALAIPTTAVADHAPPSATFAQRMASVNSASPGVRVYSALSDGVDPTQRAVRAVHRLAAAGGLNRRAVVIAVPTGSGWVDEHFVRGVEEATRGDSAVMAVQYTDQPSWQSFLFHRNAAAASAIAAIDALHRRAPTIPVYLYGQSLGTVGVVAALDRARQLGHPVSGVVQVGTPASVPLRGRAHLNPSDPVGIWSPKLLVIAPDRASDGGTHTSRPPWLPVISFFQTTVDLVSAINQPSGLGHRYDERQGSELVQAITPRAAS